MRSVCDGTRRLFTPELIAITSTWDNSAPQYLHAMSLSNASVRCTVVMGVQARVMDESKADQTLMQDFRVGILWQTSC